MMLIRCGVPPDVPMVLVAGGLIFGFMSACCIVVNSRAGAATFGVLSMFTGGQVLPGLHELIKTGDVLWALFLGGGPFLGVMSIALSIFGMKSGPRYPKGHCQTCSYDLTGNVTGICPECGIEIATSELACLERPVSAAAVLKLVTGGALLFIATPLWIRFYTEIDSTLAANLVAAMYIVTLSGFIAWCIQRPEAKPPTPSSR